MQETNNSINPPTTVPPARLFYLDRLRVLLISLIVLLHLAITYGAPGGWYVNEISFDAIGLGEKIIFTTYNAIVQAFALGFFFLLSGYFTAASLERKGTGRFIRDRAMRLGIPLVVYTAVINPILIYLLYNRQERFVPFIVSHFSGLHFSAGPMWFVAALLLFTAIYILWRAIIGKRNERADSTSMPGILLLYVIAIASGLIAFTVRLAYPAGRSMPILNFQWGYFSQYIFMFALGTMAWRIKWFERASEYRPGVWFGGVALMILLQPFPLILSMGGNLELILGSVSWEALSYALWEPFVCLFMVIGLSALYSRRFNDAGGWFRLLPPNAYGVYVIHPAVMIALTTAFAGMSLPPLVKFAVMAPIVLAACFITAGLLRAIPGVKKIL